MENRKSDTTPKPPSLPKLRAADKRRLAWLERVHRAVVPLAVQGNMHHVVIDARTQPAMIALLQEALGRTIAAAGKSTSMEHLSNRILDSEEPTDLLAAHSAFVYARARMRAEPQWLPAQAVDAGPAAVRSILIQVWDAIGPQPDHDPPRRQAAEAAMPRRRVA